MYVHLVKFKYSVSQLESQRVKFQHKICFKPALQHLRLKSTPTIALATRVMRDGKFLAFYRLSQKFFIKTILKKVHRLPPNSEFKNFFYLYQSFKDFNRVLFWKLATINCLFNLKKLKSRKLLYYMRPERRNVLVLGWLKQLIRISKFNRENKTTVLFTPIINFLCSDNNANEVYSLKLKMYKLRSVRG